MLRRQQFALLRLARGRAMSSAPMTVAVLPGDGIGPEVMDVAVKVLEHAGGLFGQSFNFKHAPVGGASDFVTVNVSGLTLQMGDLGDP